jgi:hypothetical protein
LYSAASFFLAIAGPIRFVSFSLGREEQLFALTWVIVSVVLVAAVVIALASGFNAEPSPAWLVVIVSVGVLAYVATRLLLIYPIIVVDRSFDFRQSWRLTRWRFWRVFGIWFLGLLPATLVIGGLGILLVLPFTDFSSEIAIQQSERRLAPYQIAFAFVISPLFAAVGVALVCYTYKALKGIPADATLPPPSG